MKATSISVVVPNYQGEEVLEACLRALLSQSRTVDQIVVVDDGSTDGSVEILRRYASKVRTVLLPRNVGFAAAANAGIRESRSDITLLLNNDTEPSPKWADEMVKLLELLGERSIVRGLIINQGQTREDAMQFETLDVLGRGRRVRSARRPDPFVASGCSVGFWTSAVGEPFEERYEMYNEDTLLSWASRLRGWAVAMSPEAVVRHLGGHASKRLGERPSYLCERNRLLNLLILYESKTLVRLAPLILADLGIHMAKTPLYARSYAWVLLHFRWVLQKRRTIQAERAIPDSQVLSIMSCRVLPEERSGVARSVGSVVRHYLKAFGIRTIDG